MSRYVFFYKLNSKQGEEHLLNDLVSTNKFEKSFANFLTHRRAECGSSYKTTYHQVIKSILTDFNEILPSEIHEIVRWYENNVYGNNFNCFREKEQRVAALLKESGIELLFKITSSSASCYAFIFQYGNFTDRYKINAIDENDDEGSNIKSYDFIRFLEYVILLMCKINEAGLEDIFDYPDSQIRMIEGIKFSYEDDIKLHKLIEDEFNYIKKSWVKYEKKRNKGIDERITPEIQTVYNACFFLNACLEMIESIKEENKNILMLHS
ncbi:MAG: hypothetical protein AAGC65_06965 [Mucilaginibacter sp.]|uniref:hypothetical protein n=1 Tax=Mucilaginibacter sp. TaxID=1882438 RepID=UPI0031B34BC2